MNTSLGWPNGIAVDIESQRIYWGDAEFNRIETANVDGSNRSILMSTDVPHIFGLSLLGNLCFSLFPANIGAGKETHCSCAGVMKNWESLTVDN